MTDSLLSRLQSLTEPSWQIDAEIALANGWTRGEYSTSHAEPFWFSPDGQQIWRQPPRYTASLDAALTLLPDGPTWVLGKWLSKSGDGPPVFWFDFHGREEAQGRHSLLAIALLIAIMKAREESAEGEGM